MPVLSDGQLASMRAVTNETIAGKQTRVEVQENQGAKPGQVVSDGIGGARDSWVTIETYDCDIQEVRPQSKAETAAQVGATNLYNFFLPYNAVIRPWYRLKSGPSVYEIVNSNGHESRRTATVVLAAILDEG